MKRFFTTIATLSMFFTATQAFAADDPPKLAGSIQPIVDKVLGYLFPMASLIALVFIIIGGYMWMVSGGDPSKVKQAQGTLTWAILGLVIVLLIFGILRIVINFLS